MLAYLLPVSCLGQASTDAPEPTVVIQIKGGYGDLTSMDMQVDGAYMWHGWEPTNQIISIRRSTLSHTERTQVMKLARQVAVDHGPSAFTGGDVAYTLVLSGLTGKNVEITIAPGEEDSRPPNLKALLELLWATRNKSDPI